MLFALFVARDGATAGRLLGSHLSPLQGVIAADLDGDRQFDVATTSAGHRDSRGYLQEVTVRLGASESHTLTVHTARRVHRLSARDLDGDKDRDLILESFDREPLAILLNDGEGHFELVDVESFPSRAHRSGRPSMEDPGRELPGSELGQSPSTQSAGPTLEGYSHTLVSARLVAFYFCRGGAWFDLHASGRAPPAFRN